MERVIEIESREQTGSPQARNLRKVGKVPAVVYSKGEQSTSAVVDLKQFVKVAEVSKFSNVFTLKSSDKRFDGRLALVKEVQKDFLKDRLLHVDIQALHENEEINLDVPLNFVGEAPGVKKDGGILAIVRRDLSVRCLPKLIPTVIKVDISTLGLGDSIHANGVPLPEGVKLTSRADETVVSVVATRAEEETTAVTAAAGATPAEGAAATPAAGATPAAAPAADAKKADAKKEPAKK